jgi:hypothetical protein
MCPKHHGLLTFIIDFVNYKIIAHLSILELNPQYVFTQVDMGSFQKKVRNKRVNKADIILTFIYRFRIE